MAGIRHPRGRVCATLAGVWVLIGLALAAPTGTVGAQPGFPGALRKYDVASDPRRIALVSANADYPEHLGRLPGALTDAQETARKLVSLGFTLAQEPAQFRTRDEFFAQQLFPFIDQIEAGDFVVFYFSGHGFAYGDDAYITPLEFPDLVAEAELFDTFLSVSALRDKIIEEKQPALLLMILDACRTIGAPVAAGPWPLAPVALTKGATVIDFTGAHPLVRGTGTPVELRSRFTTEGIPGNVVLVYASQEGAPALGSRAQALSPFTSALLRHLSERHDFSRVFKSVNAEVRLTTDHAQFPVISDSSPTLIYFNPSPEVRDEQREEWTIVLAEAEPNAVLAFLMRWALGPYAGAARRWLADNLVQAPPNALRTRVAAFAPEAAWEASSAAASAAPMQVTEVTGDLGLTRSASGSETGALPYAPSTAVPPSAPERPQIVMAGPHPAPSTAQLTAETLAAHGEALVLAPTVQIRGAPSAESPVVETAGYWQRLRVLGFEKDASGNLWSAVKRLGEAGRKGYVALTEPRATRSQAIGSPLQELYLATDPDGTSSRIDSGQLKEVLNGIRRDGHGIAWVSIASARTDNPRLAAALRIMASRALQTASEAGVPRGKMTVLEGADFEGARIRLRIFAD